MERMKTMERRKRIRMHGMSRPYQRLIVWQEAHKLCVHLYGITRTFPSDERFALVGQLRRSAYGVPMNIAEGNARRSKKEKMHFISIAAATLEELHYQCFLSKELEYIDHALFTKLDDHIQRVGFLLGKLQRSLL